MFNQNDDHPPTTSHLQKQLTLLATLLVGSFILTTAIFWYFEHGQPSIQTFGDAAWWWFVTSATVGYGDLVPLTTAGRTAGVIAIIIGLFSYTHVIGIILQVIQHKFEKEEKGRGSINFENHVVICEYTAFADELIQEIKENNLYPEQEVVIVGSLVNRTPYTEHSFIYGEPINPDVLKRANIEKAKTIFVFSNNRFSDPDTKTLHVVSRIKKLNNNAELYIELHNTKHSLLEEIPGHVTVMSSSDILHKAIQHKFIDVEKYLEQ
jgi:voltage-gated potassium channel